MRVLITGGAGFIGHHFVEHFLKYTDWEIVVLDKLTYAGTLDRLRDIEAFDDKRVLTLAADFTKPIVEGLAKEIGRVDYIFHLGAETHVDRSIENPEPFVLSNVLGTMRLLDFARKVEPRMFYQFSTDEVFGPAPVGTAFKETDAHNPTNPYSASKSGAEMLAKSYANTYKVPITITRTMNVFGERQHPEKFIPKVINAISSGSTVYIHSNPSKTKAGSRFWIHARNVADAYLFLVKNCTSGGEYHIVGEKEVDNLEMAQYIASVMRKPLKYEMVDFHSSRPGHDLRYALDGGKIAREGWSLPMNFEESLARTIKWSLKNPRWLNADAY